MLQALKTKSGSGESLEEMIKRFIHFQAKKCTHNDREEYLKALDSVQSGYILGEDFDAEEGTRVYAPWEAQSKYADGSQL